MNYSFIDLFAGIGGFRLGFENTGFQCVFSSEIDEHSQEMYKLNYGVKPKGDITKLNLDLIPKFEVLTAGFPCQPFSIAGEKRGFNDTRGTLFFDILRILMKFKPRAVILENVKHFKNHDNGNTLKTVINSLTGIGYTVNWEVLNAVNFGVPQNRERTIIVASLNGIKFDFTKLNVFLPIKIKEILEEDGDFEYLDDNEYTLINKRTKQKSGLIFVGYRNKNLRTNGVKENTEHLSRVHKQPNRIYYSEGTHPTLSSQESSGRYFILHKNRVRRLTLRECYRLMGFPDDFKLCGSKAKLYNRVGNSIVVPMVEEIAKQVKYQLFDEEYINNFKYELKQNSLFRLNFKETEKLVSDR